MNLFSLSPPFDAASLLKLIGSNRTKNESISRVKKSLERYECQLPNVPQNVENAQISGKNDLFYDVGQ